MKQIYMASGIAGINCTADQLSQGNCSVNINQIIFGTNNAGQATVPTRDALQILQDVFLAASMFIGVLCTLALIWSGVQYILAGSGDTKKADTAKKGIKYSFIGLVLVMFSYIIVRIIQYIAQGG